MAASKKNGHLGALAVDLLFARLLVLLLGYPHLLEAAQRGQDGAADPRTISEDESKCK